MKFVRFSAIEQFGVPLDSPDTSDIKGLLNLLLQYNVEGDDVPKEATDITPYYWQNPNFRYYLGMAHPEGPAVLEMLPSHSDSETLDVLRIDDVMLGRKTELRTIEIPTDQEVAVIAGPGPRYPGKICVHELVAFIE